MLLSTCMLALAFFAPQKQERPKKPRPAPPPPASRMVCTPTSVSYDGGPPQAARNPIAEALTRSKPGARIELESGDYPGIGIGYERDAAWSAKTSGGTKAQPVTVFGRGKARIIGDSDAITVNQQIRNGFITFQNIEIVPGYRSAILFGSGKGGWVHEGYRFIDCDIVGQWNHLTGDGQTSKWGVWGKGLKDFEFRGQQRRVRIVDLRREHAFYLQNLRGDVLIENVDAARLGRTFVQFTARADEGPPSVGTIIVRNCHVEDCCIGAGDNFKGGSAFTIAGRHQGTILLEQNRYRSGFVEALRKLTRPESPFGTGALVAWDGGGGVPNARLVLKDNDFAMAKGCGDRPLLSIGACAVVELVGENRFVAGANPAALEFEPVNDSRPEASRVGALSIDEATLIEGPLRWRGDRISRKDLLAKYPRAPAAPAPPARELPPQPEKQPALEKPPQRPR